MSNNYSLLMGLSLILAILLGYQFHSYIIAEDKVAVVQQPQNVFDESTRAILIKLPAVDREGNGAIADFALEITKGTGRVFLRVDPESPLTNPDTQVSLKTAIEVAKRFSKQELNGKNIYYSFSTEAETVEGKSAGAAMTITTIAALKNENLRDDVSITGTIEPDGTIGPIGKVLEKAKALKKARYNLLLVPKGESKDIQEVQECQTETIGSGIYKRCVSRLVSVDVEKEVGIKILEVSDIASAYDLMRKK